MNPRLNRDAISAQGGFTLIELLVEVINVLIELLQPELQLWDRMLILQL